MFITQLYLYPRAQFKKKKKELGNTGWQDILLNIELIFLNYFRNKNFKHLNFSVEVNEKWKSVGDKPVILITLYNQIKFNGKMQ